MKENISALLDNELSKREQEEALNTVSKNAEFADLWNRYNLISAAFRREIKTHNPGLAQRVAQVVSRDQSYKSQSRLPAYRTRSSHFGWTPTMAMAASIMAVSAVVVYVLNRDVEMLDANNQSSSVAIIDHPTRWENALPEHEDQLNAFLVEHGEFTPMAGLNGLVSYAKFVSYDTRK